jgi:hypothetical protein
MKAHRTEGHLIFPGTLISTRGGSRVRVVLWENSVGMALSRERRIIS